MKRYFASGGLASRIDKVPRLSIRIVIWIFFFSAPAEGTYLLQINIRQKCSVKYSKLSARL